MASRDNQNLQIVVISLVILLFILAGLCFWLNGKKTTAQARAEDALSKAQESGRSERQVQAQANSYKQYMGFSESDSDQTIQEEAGKDMERFGATFDEASRSYRNLLQNIFEENRKLVQSESVASAQVKDLKGRLLAIEKEKDAQIAIHLEKEQQAIAEKESLKNEFSSRRQVMVAENTKISDQLEEQRNRIDELLATHAETENALSKEITDLKRAIEILQANQAVPDPYAQPADGMIRMVDQRQGKVWINLGDLDRLRPQVTFSVYSGDSSDIKASESKGTIEVTRILSAHLAEARITTDEPTRPILVGDKVYSQVWNRGRKVGFAFAGLLDLDGDGKQDSAELKKVISINDGKIDAFPDGSGGVDGAMSVDTRYLVLGKYPEGARKDEEYARASWSKLNADADTLGVETISLDEFLDLLGWSSEKRTVKLGAGARPEDFAAEMHRDKVPQDTSKQRSRFRPRKPQSSY